MTRFFSVPDLATAPPIEHAAYSDRTARIMAEMSRLVYEPLPQETTDTEFPAEIRASVDRGDHAGVVEALVRRAIARAHEGSLAAFRRVEH